MVQLTSLRLDIDPFTGKPKQPWWKLGKLGKINVSIGLSIVIGLASFVLIRDDVMSKRKEQMRLRKEMREKAEHQVKEEAIKSDQ